jgi:glutathione S-transferase
MTYVLHYAPDNASFIIRMALEELGVPYQTVLVDRSRNMQHSEAYRRLNPAGMIPALETPQGVLFETCAILLWLADHHRALAPTSDHPDRGDFLKWLFFSATNIQGGLRLTFYPEKFTGRSADAQQALRTGMRQQLSTHLALIEDQAATGWSWLDGQAPSVLGLHVAACLRWCALYPELGQDWFDLGRYPTLRAMVRDMETRPAIARAAAAEGLGAHPFSDPQPADPPEGSAQ